jgi:YkoY family integral membrane protein
MRGFMFGQAFEGYDLVVIALLVVLEGVLSIDNALVLGVLAKRLPKHQQKKALTYGLVGAFVFRFLAIGMAAFLLKWTIVKLIGGGYLVYIGLKHFFFESKEEHAAELTAAEGAQEGISKQAGRGGIDRAFWGTVLVIELTDIAFAVDSILAALGVVGTPPPLYPGGPNPKLWVIIAGGFIGVIMMRFAAVLFIKLLERFPRFHSAAYLLVLVIGVKLLIDWASYQFHFHDTVNFHDLKSPYFYVFWGAMVACFCIGFLPEKKKQAGVEVLSKEEVG